MTRKVPLVPLIAVLSMILVLVGVTHIRTQAAPNLVQRETPVTVRINEVMPRPGPGEYAWVELYRPQASFTLFLPDLLLHSRGVVSRLTRLFAAPDPGADISGWQISDEDGHVYTIPDALPPVPYNAYVVIYFDGRGPEADDYDFSDRVAVLHTPPGLVDVLDPQWDQVALYTGPEHTPETIRDFVAYGGPPGDEGNNAVAAGLWSPHEWVSLHVGSGAEVEGEIIPNRSIGLYPGHSNQGADDWAVYQGDDLSPGEANPVPRAYWHTVDDGAVMASDGFALGWAWVPGATYQLQMDNDRTFRSPEVNVTLDEPRYAPDTPPPPGTYWWRVRSILGPGKYSAWSPPARVTIISVAEGHTTGSDALEAVQQTVLPITWLRQRKDTPLLCLDGDREGNPSAPSPKETWDSVHPDAIYVHGRNNCVRASIAMIVTNYGGSLSQDRLAYQLFENWGNPIEDRWNGAGLNDPIHDLGHDTPTFVCGSDGSSGGRLLAWALGVNLSDITYSGGKPSFNQIRNWINAGRPIMRFHNGHQTVIGGYRVLNDGTQQVRLFDPWSGTTWENYNSLNITCYYVPPASAPHVRSDEPGIWNDMDGDGIMDWDETNRFRTDPTSPDTDGDWVRDKQDIREYVFDNAGNYHLRDADFDGDHLRKEVDADNDNDGSVDGCEDTNYNGKYEAALGETNNFDPTSHQACVPKFSILSPTQANPANAGAYNNPDKILIQVKTATPPSAPVSYTASDFKVEIGNQQGTVVAVYRVLDTHFLVVIPPTQSSADYYDLRVTLQNTQSDTEPRAVYYLPKLRADQVLVIDRSGSMASDGKMEAAKNAARAFIDHANVGDMIGVVSFASSATVNYSLTTITGDPEWNAAKAAVNGLSAGGTTALGQGARLGYDQIVAHGQSDHDWAMVLLSDGKENVTPYWSDASVSGVIVPSRVVVHTVALGRDADKTLLASIAGQTGGRFLEAGTDILPLSLSRVVSKAAPAAMPGPNLSSTLPNRLADVYKAHAEEIAHQQRLWERTGILSKEVSFEVPVEKGIPEAIFTTNWDDPQANVLMRLRDPDGNLVQSGYPGARFQSDTTHQQYRIRRPKPGTWTVILQAREKAAEYLFTLSGRSPTTMILTFGLPPAQRIIGSRIPILAILTDAKPITGAEVWALVQGPSEEIQELIQLFDDGAHGDGQLDDGVYGNFFTQTTREGAYLVKATGWGVNNSGEDFVRHRSASFLIRPRIAYIWKTDLSTASAYRALLQDNGFVVDLISLDDVASTNWRLYSLAIVGPDTGGGAQWGTQAAIDVLLQYRVPVIGLGEGGYAFFGKLGLDIGFPNGWHGNENRTYAVDTAHQVWHSPYPIPMASDRIVEVYKHTTQVGIYLPKPGPDITLIGREAADRNHYNVVQQTDRYLLWGFQGGPGTMTEIGQHLFVNVVRYMTGM